MKLKTLFLILMVLLLFPGISYSLTDNQMVLVGLKGVYVSVSSIRAEVEPLGATSGQIKTDTELRLRKAGVRVLTEKEIEETPGQPELHVNVTAYITSGRCIYSIGLGLTEMVTLARGIIAPGDIWTAGYVGTGIKGIQNTTGKLVDQFINDYLAANPKN